MNKEKEIYVYADFLYHNCEPVGTIYVSESRGRETYAFECESSWLKRSDQFLDPDLQLYSEPIIHGMSDKEIKHHCKVAGRLFNWAAAIGIKE